MNILTNSSDKRKLNNPKTHSSAKLNKTTSDLDGDSSFLRQSQMQQSDNLRVIIRIRPPLPREIEEDLPFRSIVYLVYSLTLIYLIYSRL